MKDNVVYIVNIGYSEAGEWYEGCTAFIHNNKLLTCIHENDGNWRGEYFDDILIELGYTVEHVPLSDQLLTILKGT